MQNPTRKHRDADSHDLANDEPKDDNYILKYGKYKGSRIGDVPKDYLLYLYKSDVADNAIWSYIYPRIKELKEYQYFKNNYMTEENEKNLLIYKQMGTTPPEARKEIQAGRLKGMTDINPMWRIKRLTECFGVCGIGWKYVITSKKLEAGCSGQISAFVDVDLFVKVDGVWSDAIQGTGGSSFVTNEKNGLYQNDECFKMALTDALGIACKALGMSSDIYFGKDRTKYDNPEGVAQPPQNQTPASQPKQETKIKEWLSEEQFNKAMTSNKKGILATLNTYNGKGEKGMKKEYSQKLTAQLEIAVD